MWDNKSSVWPVLINCHCVVECNARLSKSPWSYCGLPLSVTQRKVSAPAVSVLWVLHGEKWFPAHHSYIDLPTQRTIQKKMMRTRLSWASVQEEWSDHWEAVRLGKNRTKVRTSPAKKCSNWVFDKGNNVVCLINDLCTTQIVTLSYNILCGTLMMFSGYWIVLSLSSLSFINCLVITAVQWNYHWIPSGAYQIRHQICIRSGNQLVSITYWL